MNTVKYIFEVFCGEKNIKVKSPECLNCFREKAVEEDFCRDFLDGVETLGVFKFHTKTNYLASKMKEK